MQSWYAQDASQCIRTVFVSMSMYGRCMVYVCVWYVYGCGMYMCVVSVRYVCRHLVAVENWVYLKRGAGNEKDRM